MDVLAQAIETIHVLTALIRTREGGTKTELELARNRAQEKLDSLGSVLGKTVILPRY